MSKQKSKDSASKQADSSTSGLSSPRVGASGVVWYVIGRVLIDQYGMGQETGFFVYLNGVPEPLFSGPPSEQTAHFTVRSDPFTIQNFINGDLQATLLNAGLFKLYYNEEPKGDFRNPDTFSSGQHIASFRRSHAMLVSVGPVTSDVFSAELVETYDFTFGGVTYNLRDCAPQGITEIGTASTTPLPGVEGFPVVLPFVGSSLVVGAPPEVTCVDSTYSAEGTNPE